VGNAAYGKLLVLFGALRGKKQISGKEKEF
jgi:hypothetical protein